MKDLNPTPRLKNPNRVTKMMVTRASMRAGIHVLVRVKVDGKWSVGWDTTHDVCTNTDRAMALARWAGMPFTLDSPHQSLHDRNRLYKGPWECAIPPAKGRLYRVFRAKTAAKAICAAILDHLDHPMERY